MNVSSISTAALQPSAPREEPQEADLLFFKHVVKFNLEKIAGGPEFLESLKTRGLNDSEIATAFRAWVKTEKPVFQGALTGPHMTGSPKELPIRTEYARFVTTTPELFMFTPSDPKKYYSGLMDLILYTHDQAAILHALQTPALFDNLNPWTLERTLHYTSCLGFRDCFWLVLEKARNIEENAVYGFGPSLQHVKDPVIAEALLQHIERRGVLASALPQAIRNATQIQTFCLLLPLLKRTLEEASLPSLIQTAWKVADFRTEDLFRWSVDLKGLQFVAPILTRRLAPYLYIAGSAALTYLAKQVLPNSFYVERSS